MKKSTKLKMLLYLRIKNKRRRSMYMHPIRSMRPQHGHFFTLCKSLREDTASAMHKNYFRMHKERFNDILRKINGLGLLKKNIHTVMSKIIHILTIK